VSSLNVPNMALIAAKVGAGESASAPDFRSRPKAHAHAPHTSLVAPVSNGGQRRSDRWLIVDAPSELHEHREHVVRNPSVLFWIDLDCNSLILLILQLGLVDTYRTVCFMPTVASKAVLEDPRLAA
jgi:hypothetical protein